MILLVAQFWSPELARRAAMRAQECHLDEPTIVTTKFGSFKHRYTGENIGVSSSPNITDILWDWFSERQHYNYLKGLCHATYSSTCEHYLQV